MAHHNGETPANFITLKQGQYESRPTFVRFPNIFAVLGSIEFALGSALISIGIASVALTHQYLQPDQYAIIDIGSSPEAHADGFQQALGLIKIGAPIWAGMVLMITASIGLYTVFVPGTVDSLKFFLVMSVCSMLLLIVEMAILVTTIYGIAYEVARGSILGGGDEPARIDLGFSAGALVVTVIAIVCLMFTSGLGCANICKCGQLYILLENEQDVYNDTKKTTEAKHVPDTIEFDTSRLVIAQPVVDPGVRNYSSRRVDRESFNLHSNSEHGTVTDPKPSCSKEHGDSSPQYQPMTSYGAQQIADDNHGSSAASVVVHNNPVQSQL